MVENLIEALRLVTRYETITLKEIKDTQNGCIDGLATKLTGFGNVTTCMLCVSVDNKCGKCVHWDAKSTNRWQSTPCDAHKSYDDIDEAKTPTKLKNAFRRRAVYLRALLKQRGEEHRA